jgi:peptidyl-prolyl cis-trans isomerase A (cyclophilin A)
MKKMQWAAVLAATMTFVACGGSENKADAQSPVVTSLNVQSVNGSTVTLAATATDNVAVTGYCFKSNNSMPFPTETCFQESPQISGVDLTVTPVMYVWAKDAVGNVSPAYRDTLIPLVTSLTVQSLNGTIATLVANAADNMAVTGYCFKTDNTTPTATNACFQTSSQKSGVDLATTPATYVWAKDAVGHVSAAFAGPCSASGYLASTGSTKNTVCMMTDKGVVVLALDAVAAPLTVANFLDYTKSGFYNNTVFHRIISNFMIQGGGQTYENGTYSDKTTVAPIQLEATTVTGLSNLRGTIAMARTNVPDSATSQFFINVVDNLFLNSTSTQDGYAVFGSVIDGMDVVDLIKQVPVQSNGATAPEVSMPVTPLFIQWAYQLK